jgi:Glycosyl hydrolases family 43
MNATRKQWLLGVGAAVLVVVLVIGFFSGSSEQRRLDRAERNERTLRRSLLITRRSTTAEQQAVRVARVRATKLAKELAAGNLDAATTQTDLAAAQVALANAQFTLAVQTNRRTAVQQCLEGVRRALDRTRVQDTAGATAFLRAAAPACQSALTKPGDPLPVLPYDFADPYVLHAGGQYIAFATNAAGGSIQSARSANLTTWEFTGNALAGLPPWATPGTVWAPAALVRPAGTLLYYATREAFTGRQCLTVAMSATPTGTFVDSTTGPLECGTTGAIDPSPFVDSNGAPYLLYKTERPARIWSRPLTPDGLAFAGPGTVVLAPSQRWEAGNVEAPTMMRVASGYWLFYSGNDWNGSSYAEGMARCSGPLGPCTADSANPVLKTSPGIAGPGGGELFTDGSTWRLAFHAYHEPLVKYPNSRLLHFARIGFDARGRPTLTL